MKRKDGEKSKWLQIFEILDKYSSSNYWVYAEHDEVNFGVDPKDVSQEDIDKLNSLDCITDIENECFFKFT